MDIRKWPLDKIMQLPDWCFGRRWIVSCTALAAGGAAAYDISEIAYPEVMVLWEFNVYPGFAPNVLDRIRICLGDRLPTTPAQVQELEPLIPGLGITGISPRGMVIPMRGFIISEKVRQVIRTGGRRLILAVEARVTTDKVFVVSTVVSSLPTEVPDWINSR